MGQYASFWDKTARKYAASPIGNQAAYEETMSRTRTYLGADKTVLEIGCGTGSTAILLAPDAGQITATDYAAEMIAIGTEKAATAAIDNISFIQAEITDPQFTPGSFDVVMGFNLLHLMEDPTVAINRAHALLTPGGCFISKSVCLKKKKWLFALPISVMRLLGKAPYLNFLGVEQLEQMITDAGFEIVETADLPPTMPSHFVVARKA
ncbi:MAG: class I SAM-dependent methyltransferase [Alphaproteobacteria bacterium]